MLNYILWDLNGDIFTWGRFSLQWNGLLMLLAFLVGRQMLVVIYKKEKKPAQDVDLLTAWGMACMLIGARVGHVLLYEPKLLSKPAAIFLPFEWTPVFHFTGMTGFSALGGAAGMILGVWIYGRKKRPQQSVLQVLDRITFPAIWVVALLLIGSFLNSETEGKPTNLSIGVVMLKPVTQGIEKLTCCIMRNPGGKNPLESIYVKKDKDVARIDEGKHPISMYLFFKPETSLQVVDEFMLGDVKTFLFDQRLRVDERGDQPLHYSIYKEDSGAFAVKAQTFGIARYPVQIMEAITAFILLFMLFRIWNLNKIKLPSGRTFGLGLTIFWGLRFFFEFLRENQTPFIKGMFLNKTQVICLVFLVIGANVLVRSYKAQTSPPAKKSR